MIESAQLTDQELLGLALKAAGYVDTQDNVAMTLSEMIDAMIKVKSDAEEGLQISAAELRQYGISVPDNIPDCATTNMCTIKYDVVDVKQENGMMTANIAVTFKDPFKWLHVNIPTDKDLHKPRK